jgi:hypothetical protein
MLKKEQTKILKNLELSIESPSEAAGLQALFLLLMKSLFRNQSLKVFKEQGT